MRIFHKENWSLNQPRWFRFCLGASLAFLVWYLAEWVLTGARPGGSSRPGFVCGVLAGLLFVYLFAFVLRKRGLVRWWFARRTTKERLAEHVWLGILTFPLVVLHIGLIPRLGPLALTLLGVYFVVFASGLWGLFQQHTLPRRMLEQLPDETIREQAPSFLEQLRCEAELLVYATCGPAAGREAEALRMLEDNRTRIRAARAGQSTGLLAALPDQQVEGADAVRDYFEKVIVPYLHPETGGSRVRLEARLLKDFADLRLRVNPSAHSVVAALEQACDMRRQIDQQTILHARLHGWIVFHLCASATLLVLLVWHAVTSVLYW